jgi:hypothetical protein
LPSVSGHLVAMKKIGNVCCVIGGLLKKMADLTNRGNDKALVDPGSTCSSYFGKVKRLHDRCLLVNSSAGHFH